ncbi:hypothetical protein NIASO_16230 [Niabella soli DSM 19437]|uniref:Uncharacterized protein n=1 Tax=Niabella soli DSM 19437 TaxID=929713 RepID=W0F7W1_9BACT|nr:hypothetical protein NIASO_16230 [Niabella soli DSM 19437]
MGLGFINLWLIFAIETEPPSKLIPLTFNG